MIGKRVRGMFDDVVKILTSQDLKKKMFGSPNIFTTCFLTSKQLIINNINKYI